MRRTRTHRILRWILRRPKRVFLLTTIVAVGTLIGVNKTSYVAGLGSPLPESALRAEEKYKTVATELLPETFDGLFSSKGEQHGALLADSDNNVRFYILSEPPPTGYFLVHRAGGELQFIETDDR